MKILPVHVEIQEYLQRHNIKQKFEKQIKLLEHDIHHPSLNVEILEPRELRFYSFRIDRKYRGIFFFRDRETIEIIDVTDHFR